MTEKFNAAPAEIAYALGGEVQGTRVLCPGPGHSKHDRSLSIFINPNAPDGFLVNSFAGDDWKECRDHVKAALGLKHNTQPEPSCPPRTLKAPPICDNAPFAQRLWSQTRPISDTLAECYLASRGIAASFDISRVVRFHPDCPFGRGVRHPCMVALFRHVHTDAPVAIHRTALTKDGKKIDRKWLGNCRNAAIKLSPDADVGEGLGVAEGVETALSVMRAGWRPIWALGSATSIARFPVLAGIESLTIFADHDPPGIAAASACAERWQAAGREVRITCPQASYSDFNDGSQHV